MFAHTTFGSYPKVSGYPKQIFDQCGSKLILATRLVVGIARLQLVSKICFRHCEGAVLPDEAIS